MNRILSHPNSASKLLKLTSDVLILVDKDGICHDVVVHNASLPLFDEKKLLDKNVFEHIPPVMARQLLPEFHKVLTTGEHSVQNVELILDEQVYYLRCIMLLFEEGFVLCQCKDVTLQSLRERNLEKSNFLFREIQKLANIGYWQYDSESKLFSYSGYTGIMCTESPQSIGLDTYIQQVVPEEREMVHRFFQGIFAGCSDKEIDYRINFNGENYYIHLKVLSREERENGAFTMDGYIQNVTTLRQKRRNINLLTHAINNSLEDIFATREDGTMIFANKSFRLNHRIGESEDITRMNIADVYPIPQTKEHWENMKNEILQNGGQTHFILHQPLPDSLDVLAYEGNAFAVLGEDGEKTIWAFGRDVSQRLRNEREVKQYNQVLNKILEILPASIVVKDIQSGFKYLYRNRESYNRDFPWQEVAGKDDFDFHPFDVATRKRRQDIELAESGKEVHLVVEQKDRDGNPLFLDKYKMRIEGQDFPPVLLSVEWDITDMELLRRELMVAKEKAENSDRLKSAFLANMSHEIRTPLNAIMGFTQVIAECSDAEERKMYYSIVEDNTEHLLKLINEILDLSKIESGISEFTIRPVNLHSLCDKLYNMHRLHTPDGVELVYENPDKTIVVEGDKGRLLQVVSNLIGNAFKFTKKGVVRFGYERKGKEVLFHVSDTGDGIPQEKIGDIFERFVKANNYAQGTGLGLSICKSIIERLGGQISVTSKLGSGTTFEFTLPLSHKQEIDMGDLLM